MTEFEYMNIVQFLEKKMIHVYGKKDNRIQFFKDKKSKIITIKNGLR